MDTFLAIKGQIKSEWIYEIINFPRNDPKKLKDFCPMYYKYVLLGQKSFKILGSFFCKIDDFINSF